MDSFGVKAKKKKMYAKWKQGQVTQEKYRHAACHCWEKIYVAKAQLELNLPEVWGTIKRDFKNMSIAKGRL